jgi:CheY-like chemotaxis protein
MNHPSLMPAHILVVEDDGGMRTLILRVLRENGFRTTGAGNGREMWLALDEMPIDLVLLDVMLPPRLHSMPVLARSFADRSRAKTGLPLGSCSRVPWEPISGPALISVRLPYSVFTGLSKRSGKDRMETTDRSLVHSIST